MCFFCFCCFVFGFLRKSLNVWSRLTLDSLCNRGWLWTSDRPSSACCMPGLYACTIMPQLRRWLFLELWKGDWLEQSNREAGNDGRCGREGLAQGVTASALHSEARRTFWSVLGRAVIWIYFHPKSNSLISRARRKFRKDEREVMDSRQNLFLFTICNLFRMDINWQVVKWLFFKALDNIHK